MTVDISKVISDEEWHRELFNGQSFEEFIKNCDSHESVSDLVAGALSDYHHHDKDRRENFKTLFRFLSKELEKYCEKQNKVREEILEYALKLANVKENHALMDYDEDYKEWFQYKILDGQSVEEWAKKNPIVTCETIELILKRVENSLGEEIPKKDKDALKILASIITSLFSDERFKVIDIESKTFTKTIWYGMELVKTRLLTK